MDIYYRRTFQGAWALSTITDSARIEKQYMGYTKKEATRLFRQLVKENNK